MWNSRLFWKLLVLQGALGLLLAVGTGWVVRGQHHELASQAANTRLTQLAELLRSQLFDPPLRWDRAEPSEQLQTRVKQLGEGLGARITLIAEDGHVLADSMQNPALMKSHENRPELIAARQDGRGFAERVSPTLGIMMRYFALPVHEADQLLGFVRIAVAADSIAAPLGDAAPAPYWRSVGWIFGLVYLPLGGLLLWATISPLVRLARHAEALASGTPVPAVALHQQNEIGDLARTLTRLDTESARRVGQLQENSQQLSTVLGNMVEGVISVDLDQRVQLANDASRTLLGIKSPDVKGRLLIELTRNVEMQTLVAQVLERMETCEADVDLVGPTRRSLKVLATPLPARPRPGVVLTLHDVTELRRVENMRRDFVANVSHELKTPLASIIAYAQTLRIGALEDPTHSLLFVQRIEEQADRLHQLIVDLLHLSRIESGKEAFELVEVSISEAVERCLRHCEELSKSGGVPIRTAPSAEEIYVWADQEALQTIIDNLVDNALKYTPQGGQVTVRWSRKKEQAIIQVEDTGIGIAPEDQQRIFERFYRADKARSREAGGTGLGLAIVKHLSQALGGEVRMTSELGAGSTFEVRLPVATLAVPHVQS